MSLTPQAELALDEYRKGNVHLRPIYPGVLIRVIPKPDHFKSIILPNNRERDKPVYEGIVIEVYSPKCVPVEYTDKYGVKHKAEKLLTSSLKPGDHVLFKYWSGSPIPGLSEDEYRIIPDKAENNKATNDCPAPMAIVEYDNDVRESLARDLDDCCDAPPAKSLLDRLFAKYDIIPRNQTQKTDAGTRSHEG